MISIKQISRGASLNRADFENSKFIDADFSGANITNSRFYMSDFTGADFTDADVSYPDANQPSYYWYPDEGSYGAIFHKANLTNTNFSGLDLYWQT